MRGVTPLPEGDGSLSVLLREQSSTGLPVGIYVKGCCLHSSPIVEYLAGRFHDALENRLLNWSHLPGTGLRFDSADTGGLRWV